MAASIPGSVLLAEHQAILTDPDYQAFFKAAGQGSFGQAMICLLLCQIAAGGGVGGGGGGGTTAPVVTAGVNDAIGQDVDDLLAETIDQGLSLDALLVETADKGTTLDAILAALNPVRLSDNATINAAGDTLEFNPAAAYGAKTWTANFNIEVTNLAAGQEITFSIEVKEGASTWEAKARDPNDEIVTITENGSYNTTTSWSDEQVRFHCLSNTGGSFEVYGGVTIGGSGV